MLTLQQRKYIIDLIKSKLNNPATTDVIKAEEISLLLSNPDITDADAIKIVTTEDGENASRASVILSSINLQLPLCFAQLYSRVRITDCFRKEIPFHTLNSLCLRMRGSTVFDGEVPGRYGPNGILTTRNMANEHACSWHLYLREEMGFQMQGILAMARVAMLQDGYLVGVDQPIEYYEDEDGKLRARPAAGAIYTRATPRPGR